MASDFYLLIASLCLSAQPTWIQEFRSLPGCRSWIQRWIKNKVFNLLLFVFWGGLLYSLPLCGRGRSSCPAREPCALKGKIWPLPMELRVPHVTSYARAPSSLLFLWSARYPQMPRFLQFLREVWSMPLPLMNHSALALFAQRTRIPTSARSIGFCVIWVCISSSSSVRVRFSYEFPLIVAADVKKTSEM